MTGREYRTTFPCAATGCPETAFYVHTTRADQAAAYKRQKEHPFRCIRHGRPDENLKPGNLSRISVLVATRLPSGMPDQYPYNLRAGFEWLSGLYWVPEGGTTGSGFTSGHGINAFADDFPEGTRLTVTAEVELPAATKPEEGSKP